MSEPHARSYRPWSKRAPEGRTWDDIVIGSGIGGMTTAALLAKLGRRVLVLEQHYVPGGYTHAFRRKGYTWDVGVHIVGEMSQRSISGRVLHNLTDGRLKWQDVGPIYDEFHYPEGFEIAFECKTSDFVATLKAKFPHEAQGIDTYMSEVRQVAKAMRGYWLAKVLPKRLASLLGAWITRDADALMRTTTQERLEQLISDPKLRTVLAGQWGYHGSPPSECPWALHAMVVRHFAHGAAYPVGGAPSIARELLQTVAEAGGWTRIVADVQQILVEDGRAVGVRMADGEQIRAQRVVSAVGAWSTVTRLLPPEYATDGWARDISKLPPGPAHVSLYLGFKGDIAAAGATRQCQWFYDTWSHEDALWRPEPGQPLDRPKILFTSYPSLKDPEHDPGPEQRHTGEIITFVPWETFQRWQGTEWRKRGPDYDAFKEAMCSSLLEALFEHRPELRPLLDHYELSTPLSTDLFARPYHGSIYGLASVPARFREPWLRPKSPIDGLYLSGSDVAACGVVGAQLGGMLCALAMEPWRGLRYLRTLQ